MLASNAARKKKKKRKSKEKVPSVVTMAGVSYKKTR
jgi:hypothetical protein